MTRVILFAMIVTVGVTVNVACSMEPAWVRVFDGEAGRYDWPTALEVDHEGNVYVAGGTTTTLPWTDMILLKYDPSGSLQWSFIYDSPANERDNAADLALSTAHGVYVTGQSTGTGSSNDIITIKITSEGDSVWTRRFDSEAHFVDVANAIAVDGGGYAAVVGWSSLGIGDQDQITLLYGPDGALKWANREGAGGYDAVSDVAFSPQGHILSAGWQFVPFQSTNFSLFDYELHGQESWHLLVNGPNGESDNVDCMAVAGDGTVRLAGTTGFNNTSLTNCYVLSIGSDGSELWARQYDSVSGSHSEPEAICIDRAGNTYVAGWIRPQFSGERGFLLKYSPSGSLLWAVSPNIPGHTLHHLTDLAVDRFECVYATGYAAAPADDSAGFVTFKHDKHGNALWSAYQKANTYWATLDLYPQRLALDSSGNVYVTTYDDDNILLMKYEQEYHAIDAFPGSCPNIISTVAQDVNPRGIHAEPAGVGKPTVPVAILGTKTFDVGRVDPASIQIAGLSPTGHRLMDVTRPVEPESECECTTAGADGFVDLVLYFDREQFVAALAPVTDGEVRTLAVSGKTKTGVPLSGSDCVTIKAGPIRVSPMASAGERVEAGFAAYPNPFNAATVVSFTLTIDSDVRLDVYDVLGRHVATLVDERMPAGEHNVSWDAAGWASGVYFARLATSDGIMTRKMVLVR